MTFCSRRCSESVQERGEMQFLYTSQMQDSQRGRENSHPVAVFYHIFCADLQCQEGGESSKVKKPWFSLSTHSCFSGGDRVGHSLLCSVLTWKSTTENCWTLPVPHQDALSGPHGWRPASLEYCLFPAQMKAPRLWWSGLCEVHVHCTTKEKSLSCSLAASQINKNLEPGGPRTRASQKTFVLSGHLLIFLE